MQLIIENTLEQYEKLFSLSEEEREDYFRYSMMKPFEEMWATIHVPLQAKQENGYDVKMATSMLGYLDMTETVKGKQALLLLKEIHALQTARTTLSRCLEVSRAHQLTIKADALTFGLYIADPKKLELQKGYCGFGGIPGFIMITMNPTPYNIPKLPALIAHEFHHNLRFSYFDWDHGNVTVGDYLIIEGLAESFARELYGDELLGPWVTSFDAEELDYSIAVLKEALAVKGFAEVSSYMFGDSIATELGYQAVGLSSFAGYAVGYHVVQSFLKNNKVDIYEATLLPTNDIIQHCGLFSK
ncbi:DUF2268 domain-containing protein [Caldalkalibacillus mannanilyticus]|uniref:DUF2268 domain-containing protein n=1 Tax=Caldalkalibacillus mannanilyticus TaxID=1418 RepID=UPI000469B72D|nr:DUF2268 domain-containing protein [Caldalkalibacillus mannanilyticus]